jgi:glycosyltransferase involved in cell wall biosynthesis
MIEPGRKIQVGISVIICCHNSASKLPATLKALSEQEGISGFACEIILVDNNSSDNTKAMAISNWRTFGDPFPLKIVEEKNAGLSYARAKGIQNSQYEYLVFCDDDNWLSKDYLNIVHNIFYSNPEIGMIGGVGEAVIEKQVPKWFDDLKGFGYAVGNEGRKTGYTNSVYGGGMGVRKEIMQALDNGHISFILSDRVGKNLSSGGDSEMCVLVLAAGKKIWFDERLTFKHDLPLSRINWNYYRKLRYAFGCSGVFLNLYNEEFTIPYKRAALKNLLYYVARYSHLLALSFFIKDEKYAYAMQQLGKLATLYFDNNKLKKKLPVAINNKRYLSLIHS